MSIGIEYKNDRTRAKEDMEGSDGRANVSSRSDPRTYYISRDKSQSFTLNWDDASTESGDYVAYWQNTDVTGKHLIIEGIEFGSQYGSDWQLQIVTGTGGGGTAATPVCLNRAKPLAASSNCFTAVSTTVTIGAVDVIIAHPTVGARSGQYFELKDQLRIGQDQAIALQCMLTDTSPGLTQGTIYGFYE